MHAVSRKIVYALTLLILSSYLVLGVISVFGTSHIAHQAGCEFSLGAETICPMSTTGLPKLYSALFAGLPIPIELLLAAAVLFAAVVFFRIPSLILFTTRKLCNATVRTFSLWVELFSQGIIHPKNP